MAKAKKNTLKNQPKDKQEVSGTKKGTPSKEKKKKSFSMPSVGFLKDDRVRKFAGVLLLVIAVFTALSFLSYLITREHDITLLESDNETFTNSTEYRFKNIFGQLGALTGQLFIDNWFGLASFFISFYTFLIGFRIAFKKSLLPLFKTFRLSLLGLLWFSLALGYATLSYDQGADGYMHPTCENCLGGGVGFQMAVWLSQSIGGIGIIFVLALAVGGVLIFNFNPSLSQFFEFNRKPKEEPETQTESAEPRNKPFQAEEEEDLEEEDPTDSTLDSIIGEQEKEEDPEEEELELELGTPEEESTMEVSGSLGDESDEDNEGEEVGMEIESVEEEELSEDEIDDKVQEFGEFDPTLELSRYELPNIDLLNKYGSGKVEVDKEELERNKNKIIKTLKNYNIEIASIKATIGPTVTLYEIVPAPGVRISKIKNLEDDIALSLAALGIRIIAPIPGRGTIGIEVPSSNPDIVSMRSLLASDKFQNSDYALPIALGKGISNETFIADLAKMPHLLMAGATGQGKSVGLNAILVSLLYKKHPSQIKFVLVDPKKVELTLFNKIERHFLAKLPDEEEAIITDTSKVVKTLNSLCIEMDERYELLKKAQVRNLKEYNAKFVKRKLNPENGHKYMPYIVLVVDEFADLIMTAGKEVEQPIARLAQLARAIGIHLIIATQRPSVNIITGTIKANFPARIAFRVTSKIDSRTILDAGGADQLIGRGDMLLSTGNDLIRLQCGFVDTPEVEDICDFIGSQKGYPEAFELPEYVEEGSSEVGTMADEERDALFPDAARIIVMHQQGSASLLQRKLKLGYNRAGRLVDQLENAGIIGPFEGSKARKVLVPDEMSLEQLLKEDAK
jgi:S-DNA-T family DNA segregation ATPase FtsK/SpoIIIE